MQLKGLVRFFTILLIVYSVYQLHFTWVVKGHEKKMEARANTYIKDYPTAAEKYPDNKDSQAIYQESLDKIYQERLKRLLDSTRDVTVTYGPTGKISYQQAKESELNLGLDLQGGMNVTLEVEMTGLLRALSNNSKDPAFQLALVNANKRQANSNADFITLFVEEYKKLNPTGRLAPIFSAASADKIKIGDSDSKVVSVLRTEAIDAFDRTFRILRTRIDQFGVAQPNINPDREKGIITVELPGIQDKERVRKYLQSSANLQFWEVYNLSELIQNFQQADDAFFAMMGGKTTDTSANKPDTTKSTTTQPDTTSTLSEKLNQTDDTSKEQIDTLNLQDDTRNRLGNYIGFSVDQQGNVVDNGRIGVVSTKDTGIVRDYLQSAAIRNNFPSEVVWMYGMSENDEQKKANLVPLYGIKTFGRTKAKLEGDAITDARQDYDQMTNQVVVSMKMNPSGTSIWGQMTREAAGDPNDPNDNKFIAIALDNFIYSAPRVNEPIETGSSQISGSFTEQEAQDLANILKAGKLPAPAKIVQEQEVGPTLGRAAIEGGSRAFLISFVVIFLLMLVYYNSSGWIANIALILNLLFTVGVLTGLGATLTAPGIAGLVLTIGMAVDTNVVIYERIKEELTRGKNYLQSIKDGYYRSLPPVLDGHITTLLTAIILFYFGLGPVKGFATTQILGLLLSLFCGILVSRWVTEWFTNKQKHLTYFSTVSKTIFQKAKFKFIEYRKIAYGISIVVLLLGVAAFFNGFDQGVEFAGGRSYIVRFQKPVSADIENIRNDLTATFEGQNPIIKTIGASNQLDITTSYLIDSTSQDVDTIVQNRLMAGLSKYNPEEILGSSKVLPTISDDLKKGAMWATFWALLLISIYIFIRFRDWRYSIGTLAALFHDAIVIIIVFSFFRNIMPFPLEIDQHFIAAVLTVIGFSMNDTVIIFDRIREDTRLTPSAPKTEVINRAINETLSRTVMTSTTVFLTLLILFFVGGEVTRGFAFAMLIGVITGVYSSVFVGAPILVDLARKKPLGKKADTAAKGTQKTMAKPIPAK